MRSNELNSNLDKAIKSSMEVLMSDHPYKIDKHNEDEFISDFIQNFLINTTSNSEFKINIKAADVEKGMLDVEVTEYYKQVIGTGKVSSRKTAIFEDYENVDNVYYTVTFLVPDENGNNSPIKQVNIHGGDCLTEEILPKNIKLNDGQTLTGWKLPEGSTVYNELNIGEISMTANFEFVAVISQS